jgi:hypothetical protein
MKNRKSASRILATLAATLFAASAVYAQHSQAQATQHDACPLMQGGQAKAPDKPGEQHAGHLAEVNARGEKAMGFSQTRTTHHFLLRRDGGAIQVEVNDPNDTASRDKIRKHLAEIAQAFAAGNFDTPMAVHAQVPPGVAAMKSLKAAIKYEYEETEQGGRVRISTSHPEALAAIHEFLRFQIKDHQTGDPLEVKN